MPVNLSIKNVPDALAGRLRERAERNHRSLQGELMAILETAVEGAKAPRAESGAARYAAVREQAHDRSGDEAMGQITIHIDDETEKNARASARAEGISLSKWIGERIRHRAQSEWPEAVRTLAGAWSDFPAGEQIRRTRAKDVPRRRL